jgi:hypothetical protein
MASSLCEIPMPSRTTRKSTRPEPQIDPWLPTCNRRACQFQKPIGVVATKRRWSWDGITRDLTQDQRAKRQNRTPRIADRGWKIKEKFLHFRSRAKNVLDIPSYRSGVSTSLRRLFAKIRAMSEIAMFRQLYVQLYLKARASSVVQDRGPQRVQICMSLFSSGVVTHPSRKANWPASFTSRAASSKPVIAAR